MVMRSIQLIMTVLLIPHITLNPVPCFIINTEYDYIKEGKLGDVAPTILKIMGMEIPKEMTGNILIK